LTRNAGEVCEGARPSSNAREGGGGMRQRGVVQFDTLLIPDGKKADTKDEFKGKKGDD